MPPAIKNTDSVRLTSAVTLGLVMVGHILLETGVDATFLANVPVDRLPLVTIAVAVLALAVTRFESVKGQRAALVSLLLVAAVGTAILWSLTVSSFAWSYYVLFVWSGVIGSLIVVRFWLLLGDLFTIGEGKRVFASIAMGGSVGALIGSGLAAILAPMIGGKGMLLAAASAHVLGAGSALLLPAPSLNADSNDEPNVGLAQSFKALAGSVYARRVALLVVMGGMTLTLGDFLFKSVLTEEVAAADLAVWISRIYLGLNLLSIGILAIGVTPLVRWLGVDRSLVVLPTLVGAAALGVLAGGALAATVALKVFDGTLRYSLHKTASELLYLPMTSRLRSTIKVAVDVVGQTGAKGLASLLVLGLLLLPEPRYPVALAVVLFSLIWVLAVLRLRQSYLDVFRATLGEGTINTTVDHPELDLESAGSLIQALSDPDEDRVIAAMRILVERGHHHLVPTLILYHPSPNVVARALDLFAEVGRPNLSQFLDRLVEHEYAEVRAASVRAKWAIERDFHVLEPLAEASCQVVRLSALAGLLAAGRIDAQALVPDLRSVATDEWCSSRMSVATAARLHYDPVYRETLLDLAIDPDLGVAKEAIRAIRESQDEWFIEGLVDRLGVRGARSEVRSALRDYGERALEVLYSKLVDRATPMAVRVHIPRTLSRFGSESSTPYLLNALSKVESGMLRFKVLRGLDSQAREHASLMKFRSSFLSSEDLQVISREFSTALEIARKRLELEKNLALHLAADPHKRTVGGELLVDLLRDKRDLASERLFIMLGLMNPQDDFRAIQAGLEDPDPRDHASAVELLEVLLPPETAKALIAVATRSTERPHEPGGPDPESDDKAEVEVDSTEYARLVAMAMSDGSDALSAVAIYHAGEMNLDLDAAPRRKEASSDSEEEETPLVERGVSALRDLLERRSSAKPFPVR